MAHNHRGQPIADPFLNRRNQMIAEQEMLSQRNAGLMGINYNPEESDYDEAFGPADRTIRRIQPHLPSSLSSDYISEEEKMQDRRVMGEN